MSVSIGFRDAPRPGVKSSGASEAAPELVVALDCDVSTYASKASHTAAFRITWCNQIGWSSVRLGAETAKTRDYVLGGVKDPAEATRPGGRSLSSCRSFGERLVVTWVAR